MIPPRTAAPPADPVANATVELRQNESKLSETVTDAQGDFQFVDLSPGVYTLFLFHECEVTETVQVSATEATEVNIGLCVF